MCHTGKNLRHDCNRTIENLFQSVCHAKRVAAGQLTQGALRTNQGLDRSSLKGFFQLVEEVTVSLNPKHNPIVYPEIDSEQ